MDIIPTAALSDLCILSALEQGDKFLEDISAALDGVIPLPAGDICARIRRLSDDGLIEPYSWKKDGRDVFYYRLTNLGRALLERDLHEWEAFKRRVDAYLKPRVKSVSG